MEKEIEKVEIMEDVFVDKKSLSWFINKMFNPEDDTWIWLRRIANIITIPIFIGVIVLIFRG